MSKQNKTYDPGILTDYYTELSPNEIKLKAGVWSRIERTEYGGSLLHLASPRDLAGGPSTSDDHPGVTLTCKCPDGDSDCAWTIMGEIAKCGGADCCTLAEPEIRLPDPPPAPDP